MQITIADGRVLTDISPLSDLMSALSSARDLKPNEQLVIKAWLLRYAWMLRTDERIELTHNDEPCGIAIGKAANGRPYVFDGENYWPSL